MTYRLQVGDPGDAARWTSGSPTCPGGTPAPTVSRSFSAGAAGDLLSAVVPAGTTEVVLTYQPGLLEVGWVLALVTLVVLAGTVVASFVVRRRRLRRRS